jgi:hypothetical protein
VSDESKGLVKYIQQGKDQEKPEVEELFRSSNKK